MLYVPFPAPEIYGSNTFDLDSNPDTLLIAENLASEAKSLINIIKTTPWNIRQKFQIELRKINIHDDKCFTYKMSLRIDPTVWFKYHTENVSDAESFERLYENGLCYYEKVKSETERYVDIKSEDEIKRLPLNGPSNEWCYTEKRGNTCRSKNHNDRPCPGRHYEWCQEENCDITGKCRDSKSCNYNRGYFHFSNFKRDGNAVYQCRYQITKLNRRQAPCLFNTDPNCRIYADNVKKPSCYPYFIVSARPNATPVITLNPVKHCGNEEYVQTCDAWQAVLQTLIYIKNQLKLDKLPLNRIHVNFGKWMSEKASDPTCRDCHAHINITLTRETIDKINDKESLFPSLVGSVLPPETYHLDDAWELIKCMSGQMTPILLKDNRELNRIVNTFKSNFEKLENECENLRQLIFDTRGQEIEESANIKDEFDIGRRINDSLVISESEQYSYPKWDRFLFPWNRI
jgi:hypothetical protein